MKVAPYHTNSREYPPEHRNVYHDHDNCPEGKRIQPRASSERNLGQAALQGMHQARLGFVTFNRTHTRDRILARG